MDPTFVTSNEDKVREAEDILETSLQQKELDISEIQEVDVEKVAEQKARVAYEKLGEPVIVEDTGLFLQGLNGFPGALTKWAVKRIEASGIAELVNVERDAKAITAVAFFDGQEMKVTKGEVKGRIAEEPRGDYGLGWDPIFIPEGYQETFAELGPEVKNKVSMRKKAFEKIREKIE